MKPFIVAGCGRSGTKGTARILNAIGVRASFEEYFCAAHELPSTAFADWLKRTGTAGEVSSLAAPFLQDRQAAGAVLFHQVRNPVGVISSLMGQKTWTEKADWPNVKFNYRSIPAIGPKDDPLTKSMKYWLEWNRMIEEAKPARRYRAEDMSPSLMSELLGLADGGQSIESLTATFQEVYTWSYNSGPREPVVWNQIPDTQLKHLVLCKAREYGYSDDELERLCPASCGASYPCQHLSPGVSGAYLYRGREGFDNRRLRPEQGVGLVELYQKTRLWNGIVVEVGCCQGESAELACQFAGRLYCVDPWATGFETNEPFFDRRMSGYSNVVKVKKPSVDAARDFADASVDMVYIDAMHDYASVRQDILAWFPKIKPWGWIAGHDYDTRIEEHAGVFQAVSEILGIPEYQFADDNWLFRKTPRLTERVTAFAETT